MNDRLTPIEPQWLAEANTLPETKDIRDRAAALESYAREAKDPKLIDHAVETRLLAERKTGELLRSTERAKGGGDTSTGTHKRPVDQQPTLADLGITKNQSAHWQKLAALDNEAFAVRLATAKAAAVKAIEMTAEERKEAKKERRTEREREAAKTILSLPEKRYGLIYADPEWRFEPYSRETGMDRAADNHYSTSELADIKTRDVASIAADDCILFLWATVPMLPQALEVMTTWGFEYRSHFVWFKDRLSTGYWNRNVHELLLIGVRGDIPAPAPGTQWESVIEAPTGEHSQKPETFYDLIETYFPTLPKIELNAREAREGWDRWGLEAPQELENEIGGSCG